MSHFMRITVFIPLLLLLGCHSAPKESPVAQNEEQIFRMNLHSEPSSLDPRLIRDLPARTTGKMLFEGLTRLNSEGVPTPALADKIEISADKKQYTFWLRNTYWTNGLPVTAYDFEQAWKTVLSPSFPNEFAHQLFVIKGAEEAKKGELSSDEIGVTACGAMKLVVELKYPNPYFLQLTAYPICFPISLETEKTNANWAEEQGDKFICNGPFKLKKWNHHSELEAVKNPLYWEADTVHLDKVVLTMIEDEHTELNMYENGELDWAGSPNSSIPPEALPTLKESLNVDQELFILPLAGTYCYKFNIKASPFHSTKIRRAFSCAIDRQSLIDNVLQSNQAVAKTLVPPWMKLSPANSCLLNDNDQESAIVLFEEALEEEGWTRKTFPEITLIFSRSEKHQKIAQAIQQQWTSTFGIEIHLQSYEWNTFIDYLSKHNYQVGGRSWVSDLPDPKTILENYQYTNDSPLGGNNDTQWENPEFIRLLDQASNKESLEERELLLLEAEGILLNDMPIAPIYHSTACYLKKPYVKNVYMSELCDLDFKNTYIENR